MLNYNLSIVNIIVTLLLLHCYNVIVIVALLLLHCKSYCCIVIVVLLLFIVIVALLLWTVYIVSICYNIVSPEVLRCWRKKKVSVLILNDNLYPCAHSAQVCTQCAKEVDLKLTSFDEHTRAPGAQFVYTWAIVCNEHTVHIEHTDQHM